MANATGRSWKLERARGGTQRKHRSNKYSRSDARARPAAGERERVWISGYTRSDGTRVQGHYRMMTQS
jgi:hypothetical protein